MRRPREAAPGIANVVRELATGGRDGPSGATFVRGLTLGALVGAAIAGSTLWGRRRKPRAGASTPIELPAPPGDRPSGDPPAV